MFARLGRGVVAHPWRVIAAWVIVAVGLVAFAPTLSDITNSDQRAFLPSKYESVQAQQIADRAFPRSAGSTAVIVVKRGDGAALTEADVQQVGKIAADLQAAKVDQVESVVTSPQMVAENRKVALIQVAFAGEFGGGSINEFGHVITTLRAELADQLPGTGLQAGLTGEAGIAADIVDKFSTAERLVGIVTILLIIALMLLMFRSPVAALLPIVTVALVMMVSNSVIALAGKAFDFQIGQELPILLTVVLFGIGTDYILFLLFRYRERLRRGDESRAAVRMSVHKVGQAIASAAAAVIVAFAALVLSTFESFRTMGPSLAIAVAVMLLAALTLIPAVVTLIGPRVFWPSKGWRSKPQGGLSKRTGGLVARRPALVASVAVIGFVLLAVGAVNLKQNYESIGSPPSGTSSAKWFEEMKAGFPPGVTTPTQVYVTTEDGGRLDPAALGSYASELAKVKGVGGVQPVGVNDQGDPVLFQLSKDGRSAQISVLLAQNPYSLDAMNAVEQQLRNAVHEQAPAGTTARVGGMTSAFVDVRDATTRDLRVIFPVAAALILIILALLLRAVIAPLYLMAAVALGYLATLGATTWAFQTLAGEPGLMFILPIFVYLFVMAIGTDYNILMIARLREEAQLGLGPREAADMAVEHASPSIASAGVILAGTFSALMFSGITMLTQIGFAVAVGIVLAAFVMSMLVVPSVTALIGHVAWWPGHGDAVRREADEQLADSEAVAAGR